MRGRVVAFLILADLALADGLASAGEAQRPNDGAVMVRGVTVREVEVRDVRVDQPTPSKLREQRQNSGVSRPVDSTVISRPPARRQPPASPRQPNRDGSRADARDGNRRNRGGNRFYTFRPRFNAGYGLVIGYPVIYPYAYPYAYDPFSPTVVAGGTYVPSPNRNTYTTYSNVNTYSNVDSISSSVHAASQTPVVCEDAAPCGGLSFEITPATAQIWVDGVLTGVVDDFTATSAPLLLAPGDHYVELRVAGYRTASFDVTITAGEVTPYQGTLEQLRLRTP